MPIFERGEEVSDGAESALAAIFSVGFPLGLAPDQLTQPAKSHGVKILGFPLLHGLVRSRKKKIAARRNARRPRLGRRKNSSKL